MPFKVTIQKVPAKAIQEAKKAKRKGLSAAKATAKGEVKKKRVTDYEATLFGSQLFEPAISREREIVIVFEKFTNDQTRFSKCGRFAFRFQGDFYFELFYCLDLVKDFSDDFIIEPTDRIWLFDKLTIEELESLCCKLVNAEFADNRKIELDKIFEEEKRIAEERRLEEEKMDSEYEAEIEKSIEEEMEGVAHYQPVRSEAIKDYVEKLFEEEKENEPINISNATEDSNMQVETTIDQQKNEKIVEKVEESKNPFRSLFSKQI